LLIFYCPSTIPFYKFNPYIKSEGVMAKLSIAAWTAGGLTWPLWKRLVTEIEGLGFAGLYFIDVLPHALQVYADSLEAIPAMTYLADHSQRVQIGTTFIPVAARDPVQLARQAVAIDDLSGGRFVLGLGAGGGQGDNHKMFGYGFGDVPTRMDRMEEALEVITRLLRTPEPVTYNGNFYQLEKAMVLPHPAREGNIPILVCGGGPKRTLPLVARYADIWNPQFLSLADYRERSALLDDLLGAAGRSPGAVKRTISLGVSCARTPAEFGERQRWMRGQAPFLDTMSVEALNDMVRGQFGVFVGSPQEVVDHLAAYNTVGVEEIILEWTALDDIDGLRLIAEEVLPHI
jgi:alkanesulfonate monooxygenase SsuD/methylene tetrahydromethanopterin reductase-like flavin-dependent oxidoreductase (luciferase family)